MTTDKDPPPAMLVLGASMRPAIRDLKAGDHIVVVTWLHRARRDELLTHPRGDVGAPSRGCSAHARRTGRTQSDCTARGSPP